MDTNEEKTVGTNLTTVAEFTQTALGLSELKQEFAGVVYNVENNPAELKIAKAAKKRLTTLRTTLDKTKKEVKADLLERTRKIDGEYNRLLGEIRSLEDPIGEQIDKEENRIERERLEALEAEQCRIDGHKAIIQSYRDLPGTLIGMPSIRIARELDRFPPVDQDPARDFSGFDEFGDEARDAYEACRAKIVRLLEDAKSSEEQAERQRAQDEEIQRLREANERHEREARERAEEEARKAQIAREAVDRAESLRIRTIIEETQRIRAKAEYLRGLSSDELQQRVSELQDLNPAMSEFDFMEYHAEAELAWSASMITLADAVTAQLEVERIQAEREEAQRIENARLQRERDEAQAAAKKAEDARRASLTIETAARALLERVIREGHGTWQEAIDLGELLAKRTAAKPVKVAR